MSHSSALQQIVGFFEHAAFALAGLALMVLGLGPMTSGVALQVGVLVSARVNDPRTAQQFGALFILPLTGLFMAQMSGAFVLTTGMGLLVLAGLAVVWFLLLLFGIALFEREAILTRWK